MAIVDADYRFIFIDVRSPGADGDLNTFSRTSIGEKILRNDPSLNLPEKSLIGDVLCPHFFIADDAFPINIRIMKPFSGRFKSGSLDIAKTVFNYRLSRARRTVENAFGILVMRWGCLRKEFQCKPDKVQAIVAACCVLHNYLLNHSDAYKRGTNETEINYPNIIFTENVAQTNQNQHRQPKDANALREHLKRYVNEINIIPNQNHLALNN